MRGQPGGGPEYRRGAGIFNLVWFTPEAREIAAPVEKASLMSDTQMGFCYSV